MTDNSTHDLDSDDNAEVDEYEQLKALYNDDRSSLLSVRPGGDGVILYRECGRVGRRPAVEIPHEDPYFADPAGTTFSDFVDEYDCKAVTRDGFTYVVYDG